MRNLQKEIEMAIRALIRSHGGNHQIGRNRSGSNAYIQMAEKFFGLVRNHEKRIRVNAVCKFEFNY